MSAASASGPGLYNVVLVGEVHADDLGTTLSDACSKFYATSSQNRSRFPKIAFFHEDVFEQEVQLQVRAGEKAIKVNVYPLEPPETPMGPRKQYLYDNFVHRSVPFVMTSVYFLLKGLSNLVNVYGAGEDAINALAVSRGAAGTPVEKLRGEILSEFEDVLLCTNPHDFNQYRTQMKKLFGNEESIRECLDDYQNDANKAKLFELYDIVYNYYSELIATNPQYAPFALTRQRVTLPDGTTVQHVVDINNIQPELLRFLRSERDELMVQKLKEWIYRYPEPTRVCVVVVGNDHVTNMTKLLSAPPFHLLQVTSTQLKPQPGALVLTRGLSKQELNEKYGIVIEPSVVGSGGVMRTQVFLQGMDFTTKPLGLKKENFEVLELAPKPKVVMQLLGGDDDDDDAALYAHLQTLIAKVTRSSPGGQPGGSGSSKRYKKCSKRRCYAPTRKGKISKRRSAKKY